MSKGHSSRAHAKLSASGASRWMGCPGSVRLEEDIPDKQTSYSREGTLAHEISELKIKLALQWITKTEYQRQLKIHLNNFKDVKFDKSMDRYTDQYVDLVIERINEARANCSDAVVLLEQRLDFSHLVPEGFGTGDVVIVADTTLDVIDLKYGMTEVSAIENPQLRLYALGALHEFECLYDIEIVRTSIIQPRIDNFSTEELSADDLTKYGHEVIKPIAGVAASKKGELLPGDWCKFCKAKERCRARAEKNLELASEEFSQPELLSNEELAEIYGRLSEFEKWYKRTKEYVLDQAINQGEKFPGFKLVEGRSNRKYLEESKIADRLLTNTGWDEEDIYQPRKLLTLTAMTKLIGPKGVNDLLGDLIIKPEGAPTLVPESDKRPALGSVASAEADFKNEEF